MKHDRALHLAGVAFAIWMGACSSPPLGIDGRTPPDGGDDAGPSSLLDGSKSDDHPEDGASKDEPDATSSEAGYPDRVDEPDGDPPCGGPTDDGGTDADRDGDTGPSTTDGALDAVADGEFNDHTAPFDGSSPDGSRTEGGAGNEAGPRPCQPVRCGSQSWACWPMPNAPNSGLPNAANYTDMGDGTVRDNVTCLLWQQANPVMTAYTWEDANKHCRLNTLLPGANWRLPTKIELMSIVDYARVSPAVAVSFFPSIVPNPPHWTASPVSGLLANAWEISFYDGAVNNADKNSMYLARCVKGNGEEPLDAAPPPGHYRDTSDEVTDTYTGLVWQRADSQADRSGQMMTWAEAGTYCSTLALAGHAWRLPSIQELATLVDEAAPIDSTLPTVDHKEFPTMTPAAYWASTRFDGRSPWTLSFRHGATEHTQDKAHAKCVR